MQDVDVELVGVAVLTFELRVDEDGLAGDGAIGVSSRGERKLSLDRPSALGRESVP